MLRCVVLVRTDVSEERIASIICITRMGELGTTLAATNNRSTQILETLMMEAIRSSETSVLTRTKRRKTSEDGTLQLGFCTQFQNHLFSGVPLMENDLSLVITYDSFLHRIKSYFIS
jgi:hypothetical protein